MDKKELTVASRLIYHGKIIDVYEDDVLCPNKETAQREIVKHRGGVGVLLEIDGQFILEKQFRYAINEVIIEIPAGKLEVGEDPLESAKRELLEETGYHPLTMFHLGDIYPTAGYSSEVIHLYYSSRAILKQRQLDRDEVIDLITLSLKDIEQLILENKIKDAKTIAAINLYKLHKEAGKI